MVWWGKTSWQNNVTKAYSRIGKKYSICYTGLSNSAATGEGKSGIIPATV